MFTLRNGASGETRTLTSVKKPDFESGASTSSATPAAQVTGRKSRVLLPKDGKYMRGHSLPPQSIRHLPPVLGRYFGTDEGLLIVRAPDNKE